jgi:hypothetical protein
MFGLIRAYRDGNAERAAKRLLLDDETTIRLWREGVQRRIKAKRKAWADVAYLKLQRARSYGRSAPTV